MGVCVTMFDDANRNNGGVGYGRRGTEPIVVRVVEGVRYRLIAHAQTAAGFVESEALDIIGAPGRQTISLPVAFVTEEARMPCSSPNARKPFSLPR
jgi:hypothetical protein